MPDDQEMARELLRVCRLGGLAYVETPLKRDGATYIYRSPSGERVLDPTHVREYRSVEELEQVFVRAGAEVVVAEVAGLAYQLGDPVGRALALAGLPKPNGRLRKVDVPYFPLRRDPAPGRAEG